LNGWMGNPPVVRPTLQGLEGEAAGMGRHKGAHGFPGPL
jgi:hypothetical protein